MRRLVIVACSAAALLLPRPAAADETQLTVMVFQGAQNLPLLAARAQGFFAARGLAVVADPATGLAKDGAVDVAGFANVLKLRAEFAGQESATPPPPEKYLDLSYYARARAGL